MIRLLLPIFATVLVASLPGAAFARTMDFSCALTRVETNLAGQFHLADESRSISLAVDDAQKKITLGDNRTPLDHVMITEIAISGYAGNRSLGLQRSSGHVVLQTYGKDGSKAEFGVCTAD